MNQICTSLHPVFNHINLFHGSCRILQNSLVHTAFSISAEVSTVLFHFELNPQTVLIYEKQNRKSHSWKPDWALELNAKRSMMLWFIYNWGFSFIFFYYFFTTLEWIHQGSNMLFSTHFLFNFIYVKKPAAATIVCHLCVGFFFIKLMLIRLEINVNDGLKLIKIGLFWNCSQ